MEFSMKSSGTALLARASLSTHRLLHAPLDELLAEHNVEVTVIDTGPGFTGGTYVRQTGDLGFVKPAGQPESEWELMARAMLGRALRVPLPPLPAGYELTEL
ncbi:hypothetical protein ACFWMH_27600 [Streptomyces tendae]|uniref:hypothetical protein n=1 Tax=Streptomyces tendae TaxID=1932 RepID=UPI0036481A12